MKLLLSALVLTLGMSSCTLSPVAPVSDRTVAAQGETITVRLNRDIPDFRNDHYSEKITTVYAPNEVQYLNENFACYISMKTPANTDGILKTKRVFYAKLGHCKVFDRFSPGTPNYCTTPVLHLYNSTTDLQQQKEPVGMISSWVPGNPTRRYAENIEEYVDLIKGCFDMDTQHMKAKIPYRSNEVILKEL